MSAPKQTKPETIVLPDQGPMLQAVGKGIQAFASIEFGVGLCFASMMEPAPRTASIAAINAHRAFEGKLKMVDAVAPYTLSEADHKKWRSLSSKIHRRKEVRDKLAHWMVSHYPGIRSNSDIKKMKVALVPPIWHKDWNDVIWGKQSERKVQPLILKEIEHYIDRANDLINALFEFSIAICPTKGGDEALGNVAE